jgi:glycosyltransferase involved in cell wall biosynthesis
VRLLGYVDDIGALHDEASVLAIPSRSEGLPIVLLEAMDAGLPVVATGVGEIPAVLEQGRLGSLVPAGSPGELASALWPLLDGGPTVTERADLARDSVRTKYSAAGMARQYCSLYAAVARQGCSG